MMTGTLSLRIAAQQSGMHWNVFYQPLSFLSFLICAFAETNRTPFDLAECESEWWIPYGIFFDENGILFICRIC
jgi:NADH-quinone oxidoreductase subunit H